jgi:hypothetical protein
VTSSVTHATQLFLLSHSEVQLSLATGVLVLGTLIALSICRELLRAAGTRTRRLWVFTVMTTPLVLLFAATVVERFQLLA